MTWVKDKVRAAKDKTKREKELEHQRLLHDLFFGRQAKTNKREKQA